MADAREALDEALKIQQKLMHDHPGHPAFSSQLGATHNQIAMIDLDERHFQDAHDRLQEAIRCQRQALESNPLHPVYKRYLVNHWQLLAAACKGLGDQEGNAKAMSELSQLQGRQSNFGLGPSTPVEERPSGVGEQLKFARRAFDKKFYLRCARLLSEAFAEDSTLAADAAATHRYTASRAAVLTAAGRGADPLELGDPERTQWRNQALNWLQQELASQESLLNKAKSEEERMAVAKTLQMWKQEPDLDAVRDNDRLDQLPRLEQTDWQTFWSDVDDLLTQVADASEPSRDQ